MNIVVSAGHGERDPGAIAGNIIEHLHAYPIAWHLRSALETKGNTVEFISCFQSLAGKIKTVNELHAAKPVDLAIEIHFNSHDDKLANGTEVLFYSPKLELTAKNISSSISTVLGTTNRGAKRRADLGWLKRTAPPALIVEVCFISNVVDATRMNISSAFSSSVADAIAGALR